MAVRDKETEQRIPRRGPSLLDASFSYVPAARTDIRKLFARIRKAQAEQQKNVTPLQRKKA